MVERRYVNPKVVGSYPAQVNFSLFKVISLNLVTLIAKEDGASTPASSINMPLMNEEEEANTVRCPCECNEVRSNTILVFKNQGNFSDSWDSVILSKYINKL